jgi:excisionase family DNA binding protein
MDKLLLKVAEAAELTSCSRSLGYQMVRSGEWKAIRVRSGYRIPIDELRRWIDEQMTKDEDQ